ncbi:hypothetical protein ANCCAN_04882 [Ancylostoma caninum]|uniref:Uncharacterized protein n=1 Tax=Ancylostoma caninum TaxID=29170 RepID=A0A368H162_ANCCA|nr:hypothetical protein ANCCAN_04882 [Ancylostoma caninum]
MQQRIIDRPLIMEQQSIIAQKQKFARKFEERMAEVEKVPNFVNFLIFKLPVKPHVGRVEAEFFKNCEDAQ